MTTATHSEARLEAKELVRAVDPVWDGQVLASEVLGIDECVLHAGPPYASWDDVPSPVRNSLAFGAVYEGWAGDLEDAMEKLAAQTIGIAPAQNHDIVVPLAGVCTPSMSLHRVRDARAGGTKYAVVNEGMTHLTRVGRRDPGLSQHHAWLNGPFAAEISGVERAPISLLPLMQAALVEGDDGHSRTVAGSASIAAVLNRDLDLSQHARDFLDASPAFALNLWMAASAVRLAGAEGVAGSTLVTRAGGNGHAFGIQVAARPGRWFTVAAAPPQGPKDAGHAAHMATGALGDSAVVDFVGFGGQAVQHAPLVTSALAEQLPGDLDERGRLLSCGGLGRDALRCGMTAHDVVTAEMGPLVLLGMIEATGTHGRIGGGVYQPPLELFQTAIG